MLLTHFTYNYNHHQIEFNLKFTEWLMTFGILITFNLVLWCQRVTNFSPTSADPWNNKKIRTLCSNSFISIIDNQMPESVLFKCWKLCFSLHLYFKRNHVSLKCGILSTFGQTVMIYLQPPLSPLLSSHCLAW